MRNDKGQFVKGNTSAAGRRCQSTGRIISKAEAERRLQAFTVECGFMGIDAGIVLADDSIDIPDVHAGDVMVLDPIVAERVYADEIMSDWTLDGMVRRDQGLIDHEAAEDDAYLQADLDREIDEAYASGELVEGDGSDLHMDGGSSGFDSNIARRAGFDDMDEFRFQDPEPSPAVLVLIVAAALASAGGLAIAVHAILSMIL